MEAGGGERKGALMFKMGPKLHRCDACPSVECQGHADPAENSSGSGPQKVNKPGFLGICVWLTCLLNEQWICGAQGASVSFNFFPVVPRLRHYFRGGLKQLVGSPTVC